jgi:hypothetical protein
VVRLGDVLLYDLQQLGVQGVALAAAEVDRTDQSQSTQLLRCTVQTNHNGQKQFCRHLDDVNAVAA